MDTHCVGWEVLLAYWANPSIVHLIILYLQLRIIPI